MYELKRLGENWLLRRVGGRFVRLFILKDASSVQISDVCIIADDKVYEIMENNDEMSLVQMPDSVSTKCDVERSQSKFRQQRKQKRVDYEYYTLPTHSLKKEKDIENLTNNNIISDETKSDFEDTEKKHEVLNSSPPNNKNSLYFGSDELADDQQSLSTGLEELIEPMCTGDLDAGSDFVREQEGTLKMVTSPRTTGNSASESSKLDFDDTNNEQRKKSEDVTSLQNSVTNMETKDEKVDTYTGAEVSADVDDVDVSSDDAYSSLPGRSKTDSTKGGSLNEKNDVVNHKALQYCYVVDVIPSDLAHACGIEGLTLCAIENSAIVFSNARTYEVNYSFPFPWIRTFRVENQRLFRIEIGRMCKHGPGTIEINSKYALEIEEFLYQKAKELVLI